MIESRLERQIVFERFESTKDSTMKEVCVYIKGKEDADFEPSERIELSFKTYQVFVLPLN